MIHVENIQPNSIQWSQVAPYITDALEKSPPFTTPAEIVEKVYSGEYQLWVAYDGSPVGAGITHVGYSGNMKVFEVLLVGGEVMPIWFEIGLNRMEEYAKAANCERFWFRGRKGWAKPLHKLRPNAEHLISMEWSIGQPKRTTNTAADSKLHND